MEQSQEIHLEEIKEKFLLLVDKKYRKGAKEHKGSLKNFFVIELIDNAIEECIDQFTYLHTLRENYLAEREESVAHERNNTK